MQTQTEPHENHPRGSARRAITVILIFALVLFIVFSIALPCGFQFRRAYMASITVVEIKRIEPALLTLLGDAEVENLRDIFDEHAFESAVTRLGSEKDLDNFAAALELYTVSSHELLRKGRYARNPSNPYRDVLREEVIQRLGGRYYDVLAQDPWGNPYQIYPGPWPEEMGPIPFRIHSWRSADGEPANDQLTSSTVDSNYGDEITFAWPAPTDQTFYIWSKGANGLSGQAVYDPTHEYATPATAHYVGGQEPKLMGGGDDLNNWDQAQSYLQFYH